ncbi:hypothetical protein CAAN1_01S09868 [[Candida] anglica]|uniref:C2 domain-containing protein n=1 Tax=[Candida] anglica TaxID=148631 RepID=A0ABP0EMY9_9ASCO
MQGGVRESSSRTQSIASTMILTAEDTSYENVDTNRLYEAVLKILILEYRNEARFRTPLPSTSNESAGSGANGGASANSSSGNGSSSSTFSSYYKSSSKIDGSKDDVALPPHIISSLEKRLNLIALKKQDSHLDELTRRSLLRLYSELLDPKFKAEVSRINKPEYLVMKFVSCSNKEMVKVGTIPANEVSTAVFKQTGSFVQILISLVQKDKNSELITKKLNEYKQSLNPSSGSKSGKSVSDSNSKSNSSIASLANSTPSSSTPLKYPQPSFRVSDMEQAMIELLMKLFSVDKVKLQTDIFKLKEMAQEKALHKDIQQVQFYLGKDLGQHSEKSFLKKEYYDAWKAREEAFCTQLLAKYQIPPSMRLVSIPQLRSGEDFYILPTSAYTRAYFVVLLRKCLESEEKQESKDDVARLFSKPALDLISHCSKFWRIDFPTRATSLYTAAHLSGILNDKFSNSKDLGPIDIERTTLVLHFCKRVIEDLGKLDWEDKQVWSLKDQDIWSRNLTCTYNQVFLSIKDSLQLIFNKTVKPKFGPDLSFLGEYLEADSLFFKVEETGISKKWEKRLSKTLLRVSELRYAELLGNLPRDDTLSIIHILDISDSIVGDIKMLQKRYKSPLLGFLNVSRTTAAVITGMFASDSRNILKHISAYAKQKNEFLPYADAIEAYKSLYEIREIFNQVSFSKSVFKFDLESFFYPFLEAWVEESGVRIRNIIDEAINRDDFEPIDIDNDSKKFSSSVLDIFTLIKEYLKILKSLNWSNEYQLAKVYTTLLKSISDGVLTYAAKITDKIIGELDEEEKKKALKEANELERQKNVGGGANWFNEVKNVVSNIQNSASRLETEEPYNFRPETCIALNNLSAMMEQLSKLEEFLDPELISSTVDTYEPNSNKNYTSHVFSVRIIKAENIKSSASSGDNVHPYITLIDTKAKKTIGKTRVITNTDNPEWDEEFELTLPANSTLTISTTVWDQRFGTHSICGRALLQLDPRNFKHDGLPQEIYLDLDSQGRVLLEVAVESERIDAIFVMGRAHRCLKRSQERCIKLIVQKFSRFIHLCFSRSNLRSICGNNGNIKPTQEQMDDAMKPLYDYLNSNLRVLAQYMSKQLLLNVMLAAWFIVISSADELLLPKLTSAKTFQLSSMGSHLTPPNSNGNSGGWQSAVTSAMANVGNSIGISGFGKQLTNSELETVFSWLNYLCLDFFHNDGNGPPIRDLKNEHYQALLLLPVYYDRDVEFLTSEVERLSPSFVKSLRDRNNFESNEPHIGKVDTISRSRSRAGTIVRNKTILANATAKSRAKAEKEAKEARTDPISAQTAAEDIILRLLLIKDQKAYVARRLEQRERLAHSIATERLARAAAEGVFSRR